MVYFYNDNMEVTSSDILVQIDVAFLNFSEVFYILHHDELLSELAHYDT